jgi:hypothetical protein
MLVKDKGGAAALILVRWTVEAFARLIAIDE